MLCVLHSEVGPSSKFPSAASLPKSPEARFCSLHIADICEMHTHTRRMRRMRGREEGRGGGGDGGGGERCAFGSMRSDVGRSPLFARQSWKRRRTDALSPSDLGVDDGCPWKKEKGVQGGPQSQRGRRKRTTQRVSISPRGRPRQLRSPRENRKGCRKRSFPDSGLPRP